MKMLMTALGVSALLALGACSDSNETTTTSSTPAATDSTSTSSTTPATTTTTPATGTTGSMTATPPATGTTGTTGTGTANQ